MVESGAEGTGVTVALPLAMATRGGQQPSPQHLRPCCPLTERYPCQYSSRMIRSYLFARNLAEIMREPWAVVLADKLSCHCGNYDRCQCRTDERLLVQCNRGTGSLASRARDIVLSLERCRDELHIPLTFTNCERLALALCRFSRSDH